MRLMKKLNYWIMTLCSCFVVLSSCGNGTENNDNDQDQKKTTCKVDFQLNVPDCLTTTEHGSQYVNYGGLVEKPVVTVTSDNPNNYRIEGWYTDNALSNDSLWDFDIYPVKDDMTLYAKWGQMYSVKFYLEGDYDTPVYETYVKPGHKVNNCDDKVAGYKIDNYYTSSNFGSNEIFNFDTPINEHTSLYLKTDGLIYFSANTMKRNFTAVAASISGSTAGSTTLTEVGGEEALSVNFGYSAKAANGNSDAHLLFSGGNISTLKTQIIKLKMKNLGPAQQVGFFFVGKDAYGNYVGGDDFSADNALYYNFKSNEINMSEDSEWLDIEFEVAKNTANWSKIATLSKIRIESTYASKDSKDSSNVFLFKEIYSENVPEYDTRNPKITFYADDIEIYSTRIINGSSLSKDDCLNICAGYKVNEFYSDEAKTKVYDFSSPFTKDATIYVDYDDAFYFSGKAIANRFDTFASTDLGDKGFAPTKGTIVYNEEQDAADVNFGVSTLSDPYIYISGTPIPVSGKLKIQVTLKNLGSCKQLAFYWAGVTKSGSVIEDYTAACEYWTQPILSTNDSLDGDWKTYTFDVSGNDGWNQMVTITKFRFQAAYTSTSAADASNRMLIKSISAIGTLNGPEITFYNGDTALYTTNVKKGAVLSKEELSDLCVGFKVKEFYSDKELTQVYDYSSPIKKDCSIYVDYEDTFYFSGKAIANTFKPIASTPNDSKGFTPTEGSVAYNEEQDAADVNFGVSTIADPYIYVSGCSIPVNGKTKIQVTMKNLGNCVQLAFYWAGVTKSGTKIADFAGGYEFWSEPTISTQNSINGSWKTYTFDLSNNAGWTQMETITKLRFQAAYVSNSKNDTSNRILIKSISGGK